MIMENRMQVTSKVIGGVALLGIAFSGAAADPTSISVKGNAPAICSLGGWSKDWGPGSFSGGYNAVVTYNSSDLVDANAASVLGAGGAVNLRAPLLCNTSITWSVSAAKGAFRLDSATPSPAGLANQWLYRLDSGPYKSGGSPAGSIETWFSDGMPFSGESHTLDDFRSQQIAFFRLVFTPVAQSAHMLAGSYSESVMLTVSPSL